MGYVITKQDKGYIKKSRPSLKYSSKRGKRYIIGNLSFSAGILGSEFIFFPGLRSDVVFYDKFINNNTLLSVSIEIKIELENKFPRVREICGFEKKLREKGYGDTILHLNKLGERHYFCLCPSLRENILLDDQQFNLEFLFRDLIVPYVYGWIFLDNFGKRPFGEYSHGALGNLEYYNECNDSIRKEIGQNLYKTLSIFGSYTVRSNPQCFCDSGLLFSQCHIHAYEGFMQLMSDLNRY